MEQSVTELKCKIRQLESENDLLYRALDQMVQRFDVQPVSTGGGDYFDEPSRAKRWIILSPFNFKEEEKQNETSN